MSKRKTISTSKKKAWAWLSRYIRLRDSDEFGICKCVTCPNTSHWKKMQAGHFIAAAQGNATRYIEENIHAQCYRCNINLGGNGAEYYPFMVRTYGKRFTDDLRAKKGVKKISIAEFEEMELYYKQKVMESELWDS